MRRATCFLIAAMSPSPAIELEPLTWYNPDLRTAVNVVPGLVGVILTMTMVMLTAMAVARERERGTLEQLVVSPIRRWELVVGKILPFVVIGYVQMTLVLIAGRLVFDVPVVGSLLAEFAGVVIPNQRLDRVTRFAEQLVAGYGVEADATWLLDFHEIHLLLQTNPDGRKQARAPHRRCRALKPFAMTTG